MKREGANRFEWPAFDSPLLQEVAAAFLRRRKAICHQSGLSCEREFSETAEGTWERLNLDLASGAGNLRVSVWDDGAIWVRFCVPGPGRDGGWAFLDQFHGTTRDVSCASLVKMVEDTIAEAFSPGRSDPMHARERLRKIWEPVHPRTE